MATAEQPRLRPSSVRVEIWRHEVAIATGSCESSISSTPPTSPSSLISRPRSSSSSFGRRKSFVNFTKSRTKEHVPPTPERLGLLTRVKLGLKIFKPASVERTDMYRAEALKQDIVKAGDLEGQAEENDGARKAIGNDKNVGLSASDGSEDAGGHRARKERLERAAKLLGKDSVRQGKG